MMILDGKTLSLKIQENLKAVVHPLRRPPKLVVILVGEDPASLLYVEMKTKACKNVGISGELLKFPSDISQERLLDEIAVLNADMGVDGILVQLPLPEHIDTAVILESIDPTKDVDGFHPLNVGKIQCGVDGFSPATPLGVMALLDEYTIDVKGKNVAIIGASNIVGKPLFSLMLNAGATVSLCHILTQDIALYTKQADIVCVGVGKPNLITADMIKQDAVVIDIGINRLDSGVVVGDVDFEAVSKKASFITPVPGGVGPMTIASLLRNTLKAYYINNPKGDE
ncbi:bifunctional methylenetetrahydrofolate dehydrogenase/methenyltetrahydrofolate cyclohydrolase FolD [Helicobacter fennelliae]|nr:bifunctional methylenetetrahydrofolate dehydrogenase/methenyltetrahydrofolate cyclohydrolase FolD [Helicobacter fennelliae]